jgi:hypothetical protein
MTESQVNLKAYNQKLQEAVRLILEAGEGLDDFQFKAACDLAISERDALQNEISNNKK